MMINLACVMDADTITMTGKRNEAQRIPDFSGQSFGFPTKQHAIFSLSFVFITYNTSP